MTKKYELTSDTIIVEGRTLYRIRAIKSFGHVGAGALGGYIENERNLSHEGNAWVANNARAYEGAHVSENAWLTCNALARGKAKICGAAIVSENAEVAGNATIKDNVFVGNYAKVCGDASAINDVRIFGNALVRNQARLSNSACVRDNAKVGGESKVSGNTTVGGDAQLCGTAETSGHTLIYGNAYIYRAKISGEAHICGDAHINDESDLVYISALGTDLLRSLTAYKDTRLGIRVVHEDFNGGFEDWMRRTKGDSAYKIFADFLAVQLTSFPVALSSRKTPKPTLG